jgi:hypothetical protein
MRTGHESGLCNHEGVTPKPNCGGGALNICTPAAVVCKATNVSQVTGFIGNQTAAGRALVGANGVVAVDPCLEHLIDIANDWSVLPHDMVRQKSQNATWYGATEVTEYHVVRCDRSHRMPRGTRCRFGALSWHDEAKP